MRAVPIDLPEHVITLEPRLDFKAWNAPLSAEGRRAFQLHRLRQAVWHQSSIDRVLAKLGEKHWMFRAPMPNVSTSSRCADCRVEAVVNELRSARGAAAPARDDDRGLFARATPRRTIPRDLKRDRRGSRGRHSANYASACDLKAAGIPGVKHVIAVRLRQEAASKSTTSCNLALASRRWD